MLHNIKQIYIYGSVILFPNHPIEIMKQIMYHFRTDIKGYEGLINWTHHWLISDDTIFRSVFLGSIAELNI